MVFEPFLKWLTEQYCIVKKSEVEKQIKDIEDDFAFYGTPKSGNFDAVMYQRARGRKQILLRVFGTDLFKERSEK